MEVRGMVLPKGKGSRAKWAFYRIASPATPIENLRAYFQRLSPHRAINLIVLHHTGVDVPFTGVDGWYEIDRFHRQKRKWLGIAYHYGIDPDGGIWSLRPVRLIGAHAEGHNALSIGIVVWGDKKKTQAQYQALNRLLQVLQERFPSAKVALHGQLKPTACPSLDTALLKGVRWLK
jgi:N-acetyl-anhydromuramyl-L-alanine amidase AmpD